MDGVIEGGWEYVVASYAIVWGTVVAYAVSILMRRRRAERDAGPDQGSAT